MHDAIDEELGSGIDLSLLAPAERAALLAAIRDARERQRAALHASIDAAMDHVPRLLRAALRKVLFR